MSTTAKGSAFEDRVYGAIGSALAGARLGLDPRVARIYKRRGYFSRDRNDDIILDVSIEVWLPSAPNWSLLWACECKDYASSVPVDEVEEFKAKLDQVSGANRKGVMAISGAMQSSALNYARSHGIGVVRLLPDDQVEHVLYSLPAGASHPDRLTSAMVMDALITPNYIGRNNSFFGAVDGYVCGSWESILTTAFRVVPAD